MSVRRAELRAWIALALGAVPLAAAGPHVVELRYPPSTVTRLEVESGASGYLPTCVGDVDGDGLGDLVVQVPHARDGAGQAIGGSDAVLVYGGSALRGGGRIALGDVRTTKFVGADDLCFARGEYAGLGDLDGDGCGDIALGMPFATWNGVRASGQVVVVFGARNLPQDVALGSLGASGLRHCRIVARTESLYAGAVGNAGDLDGDGKNELAVAAQAAGTEDDEDGAGQVFVIAGGACAAGQDIELGAVGGATPGFVLRGAEGGDALGTGEKWCAALGDANGDGHDDFAVAAPGADGGVGAVYLVLGGPALQGVGALACAAPGGPLVEIAGITANGRFGHRIAAAGDVDGDGLTDMLVTAKNDGAVYVLFGARTWQPIVTVDRLRTFVLRGKPDETGGFGGTVAGMGDWNGDGLADFVTSNAECELRHGPRTGEGYVVFGSAQLAGEKSVGAVGTPELPGVVVRGEKALTWLGRWADGGGDLDGDGRRELVLEAPYWGGSATSLPLERSAIYVLSAGADAGGLRIDAVVPCEGSAEGGYEATIWGSGFGGEETVAFGEAPAQVLAAPSSAELHVVVPPRNAFGKVDVLVRGAQGTAYATSAFEYAEVYSDDLVLDPHWLRARGLRVLEFTDVVGSAGVHTGDVNADGIDDLFVLDEPLDQHGGYTRLSVLFGARPLPDYIGPGEAGAHGTVFDFPCPATVGGALALPGDVNGDGRNDLVVTCGGSVYVVFGRDAWPATVHVGDEIVTGGAIMIPCSGVGKPVVAAAGDVDGDGAPEVALGAWDRSGAWAGEESRIALYGRELTPENPAIPSPVAVVGGDPTPIVSLVSPYAETVRSFGCGIAAGGDLNADGHSDLLVGAWGSPGAAYVLLGGTLAGEHAVDELVAAGRAVFLPYEQETPGFGRALCGLGDFDGDGIDDVAFGAPGGGRVAEGATFVVFGARDLGAEVRELRVLGESRGRVLTIAGEYGYDWAGYVHALGDVNGDGKADLGIVSRPTNGVAGRGYVVLGSRDGAGRIELANLGRRGFRLSAVAGRAFSLQDNAMAAGDFDGDGYADLAVADGLAPSEAQSRVLVVFGRPRLGDGFVRTGDFNEDGKVDIADAIRVLGYLFGHAGTPGCMKAGDANDDDAVDIADAVAILSYLFAGRSLILPDGRSVAPGTHPGCAQVGPLDIPRTIAGEQGCVRSCGRKAR